MGEAEILQRNRLGGPEGVNATGPPLDPGPLPWPPEIKAAFAISMRHQRWQGMQARLGPWASHVQMWNATNGYTINPRHWVEKGKAAPMNTLSRGQLGCHDSHFRLWEHMVKNKIPMALIMEDDANVRHTRSTATTIRNALDEATRLKIPWHIMYLGRQRPEDHMKYSATLSRPRGCCGLFAYLLTLEGATRLTKHCGCYRYPVDVLVGRLSDQNIINSVAINPRMCWVVPVRSDTNGIY